MIHSRARWIKTSNIAHLGSLVSIVSLAQCLVVAVAVHQVAAAPSGDDTLPQQAATNGRGDRSNYPDYSWFVGLENRILAEYPELRELVKQHDVKLNEPDYLAAVELHKEIFMRIYQLEKDKLSKNSQSLSSSDANGQLDIYDVEHRAAYKLFDLWANTLGDFEGKRDYYSNYLEPYLIQSNVEFWSFCFENRQECHEILNQFMVLASEKELGPIELIQISMNVVKLMNHYKADLVLERLIKHNALTLRGQKDEELDAAYDETLSKIVQLIEIDEAFNEATFHYAFIGNEEVHKIVDSKIESYFADLIENSDQHLEE